MNYSELISAIKGYSENDFPSTVGYSSASQIDSFIRAAEQEIYTTVRLPHLRANARTNLVVNDPYVTLPKDLLAIETAWVELPSGELEFLRYKHESFIRESYPNPKEYGVPRFISIFGPNTRSAPPHERTQRVVALLGPTPNASYPFELHYTHLPVSITDTQNNPDGTTWLSSNAPNALLYGALVEATLFMQHDELHARYQARYTQALQQLAALATGSQGVIA